MAAIQYLNPGGAYVNEDTAAREILVPGGAYVNEASLAPITGTLAVTLAALTATSAGAVAIAGAAAPTLGALTVVSAGTVAIAGTATSTLGVLTSAAAGTVAVTGAATLTLGTLTVTAAAGESIAGSSALTLAPLTSAAIGLLLIKGIFTDGVLSDENGEPILDEDGNTITDETGTPFGPLTLVATGTVVAAGPVVGSLAASLDALILDASGIGPPPPPPRPAATRVMRPSRSLVLSGAPRGHAISLGSSDRHPTIPVGSGHRRRRP